jgi:outer membrane protein OmpA-like peptidoglycan-associated protein
MYRRFAVSIFAGMLLLSGCSTKKWVRQQTDPINQKVTTVENQTRENAERIDAVDKRATQGISDANAAAGKASAAAQAADTRAGQAQTAATAAQTAATGAQKTADTANQGVQTATTRIAAVDTRVNTLIQDQYTAAGSETLLFKVGSAKLEADAIKSLDNIATQVGGLRVGYVVEIQGFASAEGGATYNLALSQDRAEAAQRYLVGKNVPLFRISMLGLGIDKPVGDNKTRAGREQNRRVEVRIMRSVAN